MTIKRQFLEVATGQLHVRTAGEASSKPAIICLHMMPKSSRGYARLMPELAQDRLVIAPDYPGYGESSHFPDRHKPSVSDYADSIEQVVEHFGLDQVLLVGYHTGSMVAVELAYRHPELVMKVINIAAPLLTKQEIDDFHKYYAPIPLDKKGTRFSVMWERVLFYGGPGFTLEMAADSMAENLRGGERYEDGHAAAFDYAETYARRLQVIEQPVWVMNLADDLAEHSRRAVDYLNNGHLTEFPDWGHGCLELWPVEVAREMLNFLDA